MKEQGAGLSAAEKRIVAEYLAGKSIGQVNQGGTTQVVCQVTGGPVQDRHNPNLHGNVWDKVPSGYISDLYVLTANSNAGQMSYPQVWPCT